MSSRTETMSQKSRLSFIVSGKDRQTFTISRWAIKLTKHLHSEGQTYEWSQNKHFPFEPRARTGQQEEQFGHCDRCDASYVNQINQWSLPIKLQGI